MHIKLYQSIYINYILKYISPYRCTCIRVNYIITFTFVVLIQSNINHAVSDGNSAHIYHICPYIHILAFFHTYHICLYTLSFLPIYNYIYPCATYVNICREIVTMSFCVCYHISS